MKLTTAYGVFRFSTLARANVFTNRCHKLNMVILGDDGRYWVVTPRVGEQLVAQGYEYAC